MAFVSLLKEDDDPPQDIPRGAAERLSRARVSVRSTETKLVLLILLQLSYVDEFGRDTNFIATIDHMLARLPYPSLHFTRWLASLPPEKDYRNRPHLRITPDMPPPSSAGPSQPKKATSVEKSPPLLPSEVELWDPPCNHCGNLKKRTEPCLVAKDRRHRDHRGFVRCEKCHYSKRRADTCAPKREKWDDASGKVIVNMEWRPTAAGGRRTQTKSTVGK